MEIGWMTRQHVDQIAEMEIEYFSDPWSASAFYSELSNPLSTWLTATNGDMVIGYVGAQSVLDAADVMNVAVRAQFRRQGVAAQLLNALADHLKQKKIRFLTLEVRKSNDPAIQLYQKLGFGHIGTRPNYYRHPKEDALILQKEL